MQETEMFLFILLVSLGTRIPLHKNSLSLPKSSQLEDILCYPSLYVTTVLIWGFKVVISLYRTYWTNQDCSRRIGSFHNLCLYHIKSQFVLELKWVKWRHGEKKVEREEARKEGWREGGRNSMCENGIEGLSSDFKNHLEWVSVGP